MTYTKEQIEQAAERIENYTGRNLSASNQARADIRLLVRAARVLIRENELLRMGGKPSWANECRREAERQVEYDWRSRPDGE